MNHSPALDKTHHYYCLTACQDLLRGFQIPLHNEATQHSQNVGGFGQLVDMDLISMRKVRQSQKDRDWDRVCHLSVRVPQEGHWFFSDVAPQAGDVPPTAESRRKDFIDLISQYGGAELAQYFNDYFHQQGFDALARTIVSSLLQQQYNDNDVKSIRSLKEVANGYAVGTYFKNPYSHLNYSPK